MEQVRHRYLYDGPVRMFEQCVSERWVGETLAVSERKAKCNLLYRWKKEHGYTADAKITLPGRITIID